jgi:hypothetical protein
MPSPFTLPIVAGLSIVGGLSGIWLGHSAIGQVNPFFFSAPETRFHADQAPYRSPDWAQLRATEEAMNAGSEIVSCIGCNNWPEEYRPVRDAAFRTLDSGVVIWPPDAAAEEPAPGPAVAAAAEREPDPDWRRVQAYSSYPIDSRDRRSAAADAADKDDEIVAAVDEAMDARDGGGTE